MALLANGSFEGHWYHPGDVPELQIPDDWAFWFFGPEKPNPIDSNPWAKFQRPEVRVLPREMLPEHERDLFVLDGDQCLKIFKGNGSWWAGLSQEISPVPGRYRFTVKVYGDLVTSYQGGKQWADDPMAGRLRFHIGDDLKDWQSIVPGQWNEFTTIVDNRHHNVTPLGISIMCPFPLTNSGIFADDWTLEKIDEAPSRQYERTIHLVPQDVTPAEFQQVIAAAYPLKESITFSADDSLIDHPNLTRRAAHVWEADRCGGQDALRDFAQTYYPPEPVWFWREFEAGSDWDRYLLSQGDERWRDDFFGGEDCRLTIGESGCYITCLAMAVNVFENDVLCNPSIVDSHLGYTGYHRCLVRWDAVRNSLDIDISGSGAPSWHLRDGGLLIAEVKPTSLQHFVLVVEQRGDDWLCLDPFKNTVGLVGDLYEGVESWRFLSKVEDEPDPEPDPEPVAPIAQPLSLHIQTEVEGWEHFIEKVKPSWCKLVNNFELSARIKQLSPTTKVLARHHIEHQAPYLEHSNPKEAARSFLDRFIDSVRANPIDCIEGLNETIGTGDVDGIKRAVAFEVALSDLVRGQYGDEFSVCLLNTAVGNPGENELHLLLPAAQAAMRNGHYLGYHSYWPCAPGHWRTWFAEEGRYHHYRFAEWDEYFADRGVYPKYLLTEVGAIAATVRADGRPGAYNAAAGWRHETCLEGDWPNYLTTLECFKNDIWAWNFVHNRCEGAMIFTIGQPYVGWKHFKLWNDELRGLAEVLIA